MLNRIPRIFTFRVTEGTNVYIAKFDGNDEYLVNWSIGNNSKYTTKQVESLINCKAWRIVSKGVENVE